MWKKMGMAGFVCLAGLVHAQVDKFSCDYFRQGFFKDAPEGTLLNEVQLERLRSSSDSEAMKWSAEGLMRICGVGLPVDFAKGLALLEQAARAGRKEAVGVLTVGYATGQDGFPKDVPVALNWLRLGAEKGDPDLQMLMGQALFSGELGLVDSINGERWLTKAASGGHGPAMSALGGCISLPHGMT